jgi:hypothetical protein
MIGPLDERDVGVTGTKFVFAGSYGTVSELPLGNNTAGRFEPGKTYMLEQIAALSGKEVVLQGAYDAELTHEAKFVRECQPSWTEKLQACCPEARLVCL